MGGAIARGMCKGTIVKPEDIMLSNRSAEKLNAIKAEFPTIRTTCSNVEAAHNAHLIILAVKPWLIKEVINEIAPTKNQIVSSVAAGINFDELDDMLSKQGHAIFRIIPNTAISMQESMTLISSYNATAEQEKYILDIFNEMGVAMLIPERQMSAATSMTSCGIAYALKYSKAKVIQYFCEEYYVKSHWQNEEFLWMFPFMDQLIEMAVKENSSKAVTLLDAAIKHNEETYNNLKKAILYVAKHMKEARYRNTSFQEVISHTLSHFCIYEEKNVVSFHCYYIRESQKVVTNIIHADVQSKKPEIQSRIDRLNELYFQIINIKDHLIKQ